MLRAKFSRSLKVCWELKFYLQSDRSIGFPSEHMVLMRAGHLRFFGLVSLYIYKKLRKCPALVNLYTFLYSISRDNNSVVQKKKKYHLCSSRVTYTPKKFSFFLREEYKKYFCRIETDYILAAWVYICPIENNENTRYLMSVWFVNA